MLTPNHLQNKTVLVVDDEADLKEIIAEEFTQLKAHAHMAGNVEEAFASVEKYRPDIIVSDIRMPGGDGVELLKNIRFLQMADPVVVFISGFNDLPPDSAYHFGAVASFAKPFDLQELLSLVNRSFMAPEERWRAGQFPSMKTKYFAPSCEAVLGRGGAFVPLVPDDVRVGDWLQFKFHVEGQSIEGLGVVRWVRRNTEPGLPAGMGLEFMELSASSQQLMKNYLSSGEELWAVIPRF